MKFLVLGAAAGGGLPQWNCGCRNCVDARAGRIPSSGQSSLAVSADGGRWSVLNASPDIRAQMQANPALHPRGLRDTPLHSVLLTNGDIDHVAGLLSLREQTPFTVFATAEVLEVLAGNRIFDALAADKVARRPIRLNTPFDLQPGLTAELFPVPGKVPLYMEGEEVETDLVGEQTVGVRLSDGARVACYIPGCAEVTPDLLARISDADQLFFDGTLWTGDEMIREGTGTKSGRRMGHISISGPEGSMAKLAGLGAARTYIHINNTNPVWQPDGPERAAVQAAGWTIAADGMEITL
ncbi:pyrroloquinoline quinone biosynthesis protein PqqB [Jhaorihella thermophila]|uniref:Coenzyme PQQ synthesis protein B n=1 Tax=Jhaorihella thermophila TaxID=488547 RepID=A0A1H5RYN2_9RHOB|nr:pyrroloquinoline quinone biosynthesis protein PqqB [Jhaorihella thermophila]SEF43466.1 pyrroloquinoline quinone biosynthesis protein B [Jhaorihella thermophila]